MLPIAGKPILGHILDRLSRTSRLDAVVVATPATAPNDVIESYCADRRIACFRGSEDDVLDRTLGALQMMDAVIGVEVFGDCPLIDPTVVDEVVEVFLQARGKFDFVSNDLKTTYPPGMEVEVFTVSALKDAADRATDPAVRAHGTLYIRQTPHLYRLMNVEAPPAHRRPELELEVDSAEDAAVIAAILHRFGCRVDLRLDEIITFMDSRPDLQEANAHVPRRWKAFRASDEMNERR